MNKCAIIFVLLFSSFSLFAQVGVSTEQMDSSAAMEIISPNNNTGVIIPSLSELQIQGIASPANGLMVYNRTINKFVFNAGSKEAPNWAIVGPVVVSTSAEINAVTSPVEGDVRFNSSTGTLWYRDNDSWEEICNQ